MTFSLIYCRAGFENDCASEIMSQTQSGYVKTKPGLVEFHDDSTLNYWKLVFARQLISSAFYLKNLPETDRITPIWEGIKKNGLGDKVFKEVVVETTDTEETKPLLQFCKSFANAVHQKKVALSKDSDCKLHIVFDSFFSCYVGFSQAGNSSPHFMGIPRLKFPKDAPSRSALKLDEAFQVFFTEQERAKLLKEGETAVDLGAAPGGWTYQLVQRGIHTYAIDNGPMDKALMDSGKVEHVRADAFKWFPEKRVKLMVCDIVEKPSRVTQLMVKWLKEDHCHTAVFNLKLPMKKRFEEVKASLNEIEKALYGHDMILICKQLYHDREEVTVRVTKD